MANGRQIFFIGVVGGLVGYACGAAFTPTRAVAQQIASEDAGATLTSGNAEPSPGASSPSNSPRPACLQWQVKPGSNTTELIYPGGPVVTFEEGWEPFGYESSRGVLMLRRCIR